MVLAFGGSQGARPLNDAIAALLDAGLPRGYAADLGNRAGQLRSIRPLRVGDRARAPVSLAHRRTRTPRRTSPSRAPARSRWPSSARGEFRRCSCRCPLRRPITSGRTRARSRLPGSSAHTRAVRALGRSARAQRSAHCSAAPGRLASMAESASAAGDALTQRSTLPVGYLRSTAQVAWHLSRALPRALYCDAPHDTFRCPRFPPRPLRRHRRRRDERARRAVRPARDRCHRLRCERAGGTATLERLGIAVAPGHDPAHVAGAQARGRHLGDAARSPRARARARARHPA